MATASVIAGDFLAEFLPSKPWREESAVRRRRRRKGVGEKRIREVRRERERRTGIGKEEEG